jgi:hypothetical protein
METHQAQKDPDKKERTENGDPRGPPPSDIEVENDEQENEHASQDGQTEFPPKDGAFFIRPSGSLFVISSGLLHRRGKCKEVPNRKRGMGKDR